MNIENTVFIFDLDGTLIKTGEKLDQKLVSLFQVLIEQSRILIATARHPWGVRHVFGTYFEFIPTISLNGAAFHLKSWSIFDKAIFFPETTVKKLYTKFIQNNITATFYGKEFWAITNLTKEIERESYVTGITPVEWNEIFADQVLKILVIDIEHKIRSIRFQISQETPKLVQMSKSFDNYLEISPLGVEKCVFLPEILNSYFIKKTKKDFINTCFIGDSDNDVPCAKVVDEAWAFKSSPGNLKALSKGILPDENGKGVRKFLQRFL